MFRRHFGGDPLILKHHFEGRNFQMAVNVRDEIGPVKAMNSWQFFVTFLGWWKRDPFIGCWWPPTFGDQKVTNWITWNLISYLFCFMLVLLPKVPQKESPSSNSRKFPCNKNQRFNKRRGQSRDVPRYEKCPTPPMVQCSLGGAHWGGGTESYGKQPSKIVS